MGGAADVQGEWGGQALFDPGSGLTVGPVDEERADAQRPEVVHRELEQRLEHLRVAVDEHAVTASIQLVTGGSWCQR